MSDPQRERTPGEGAVRDAGSVDLGSRAGEVRASKDEVPPRASEGSTHNNAHSDARDYASESVEASLGRDPVASDQDDHERDPVSAAQPAGTGPEAIPDEAEAAGSGEPSIITVRVVGRTDVGLVREHNEDNYLLADLATGSREAQTFHEISPAGVLFAVCDGMGGAAAGEVASQMAVDTLYEMMRRSVPQPDRDALARSLVRSVEEAGTRIFESARADRSRRGMGTTATVAALMDRTLFVGQVGDSRAYVLRSNELKQITKDQSLVNQLIEAGQLTEDEAEAFEHSNIILQALGTTEAVSVDLTFLELRAGDRLLMCSDGLSGLVHGDVIRDVLSEVSDLDACCERLIELAKAGGGHDNVTVILAEFGGPGLAPPQPTDLVGYQQYPLPLDQDRRPASALHSDMPTLAPPSSLRAPPMQDSDPVRDLGSSQRTSSSAGRLFLFAILIVGAAGAVYYWMATDRERQAHQAETPALTPALEGASTAAAATARVEIGVKSEVESGELVVDGESYGTNSTNEWVLELPPGPHRLEARSQGNTITWKRIDVRDGFPEDVLLSLPVGTDGLLDAGSAESESARSASTLSREAKRREREKRSSADAGRPHRRRAADRGGVFDPSTSTVVVPVAPVPGGLSATPAPAAKPTTATTATTTPATATPIKPSTSTGPGTSTPTTKPSTAPGATDASVARAPIATPTPSTAATPKRDH
jgi:serine/threonine protein phosphatase PrpC